MMIIFIGEGKWVGDIVKTAVNIVLYNIIKVAGLHTVTAGCGVMTLVAFLSIFCVKLVPS